ncbi:hypothetical protein VTN77DRAFT_2106 [Rasamsonia byssochlamydoides]|uniref:uncharacterized protein n=1 Tax=Rasamsonia byssochlamydoides TaxID=89139 RepID=UPI003741FA06
MATAGALLLVANSMDQMRDLAPDEGFTALTTDPLFEFGQGSRGSLGTTYQDTGLFLDCLPQFLNTVQITYHGL